jgi:hypothetical protein
MSKEAPSRLSKLSRFYEQSVGKPHIATAVTDHEPWDAEVESIVRRHLGKWPQSNNSFVSR